MYALRAVVSGDPGTQHSTRNLTSPGFPREYARSESASLSGWCEREAWLLPKIGLGVLKCQAFSESAS